MEHDGKKRAGLKSLFDIRVWPRTWRSGRGLAIVHARAAPSLVRCSRDAFGQVDLAQAHMPKYWRASSAMYRRQVSVHTVLYVASMMLSKTRVLST